MCVPLRNHRYGQPPVKPLATQCARQEILGRILGADQKKVALRNLAILLNMHGGWML
jgi:hypothetical protein